MKLRNLLILLTILVSLVPVYLANRWLLRLLRPRQSMGRLFLYLLSGFLLVFAYTFIVVFVIKKLFPASEASHTLSREALMSHFEEAGLFSAPVEA